MARHSTRPLNAPERDLPDVGVLTNDQRARRQRIVEAARQLMVKVEYGKIQVKDVAEEAEVSLGTLYRYFNSKDHLFACALAAWAAPVDQELGGRTKRTKGSPVSRARSVFHHSAQAFEDAPNVYGALMQLHVSQDRYAVAEFQAFAQRELKLFTSAVADVPAPLRDDVVSVLSSVLAESLRGYVLGMYPMKGVYQRLDRAVKLIFRAPFDAH